VETWKPVVGFENSYEVSTSGRVRSLRAGKLMAPQKLTNGYMGIHLAFGDGRRRVTTVHRLVAEAFIPNPSELKEVNHVDFDKSNNVVANLEWASRGQNSKHNYANGRVDLSKLQRKVKAVDAAGEITVFASQIEAEEKLRGSRTGGVCRAIRTGGSMYGYRWFYA
jgi:hypothetical protein